MAIIQDIDYKSLVLGERTDEKPGPQVEKLLGQMQQITDFKKQIQEQIDTVEACLDLRQRCWGGQFGADERANPSWEVKRSLHTWLWHLRWRFVILEHTRLEPLDEQQGEALKETKESIAMTMKCLIALTQNQQKWKGKYGTHWQKPRTLVQWHADLEELLEVLPLVKSCSLCINRKLWKLGWNVASNKFLPGDHHAWQEMYLEAHPPEKCANDDSDEEFAMDAKAVEEAIRQSLKDIATLKIGRQYRKMKAEDDAYKHFFGEQTK